MRKAFFAALIAATLGTVPVEAQEGDREWFGTFRPAVSFNFTAGTTELHNSVGLTLGGHIALARLGHLRFPVVGMEAGFASKCDPNFTRNAYDPMDDGCRGVGLFQFTGGAEVVFDRYFRNDNAWGDRHVVREMSLYVVAAYPVAGPLKEEPGVSVGIAVRWQDGGR